MSPAVRSPLLASLQSGEELLTLDGHKPLRLRLPKVGGIGEFHGFGFFCIHRIHGIGRFTYMNGGFLCKM